MNRGQHVHIAVMVELIVAEATGKDALEIANKLSKMYERVQKTTILQELVNTPACSPGTQEAAAGSADLVLCAHFLTKCLRHSRLIK